VGFLLHILALFYIFTAALYLFMAAKITYKQKETNVSIVLQFSLNYF